MPADDDELEGDDKLTAMRSVWLSMRDEEPSDKGLAALMAAAREKAGAMKDAEAAPSESWWQKVLAVFRRPPVLALASVAILVSGALVIANRSDTMAVDEKAASRAPAPTSAPALDHGAGGQQAGSAALDVAAPGSASPPPSSAAATVPEATTEPRVMSPDKNASDAPAVKPRPAREKAAERRPLADPVKKTEEPPAPPPPPPEPVAEATVKTDAADGRAPATRGPATKPPQTEPTAGGIGATSSAMTDGESMGADVKDKDEATSARQSRVLQLVKQCESAAARGDCAAVKALAARIRTEDASAYRARVVKNASIARCLE